MHRIPFLGRATRPVFPVLASRLFRVVVILGLAHFVIDWLSNAPPLLLVVLRRRYLLDATQVGLWMAVFSVCGSLLQAPLGWLAQRMGWYEWMDRRVTAARVLFGVPALAALCMALVPLGSQPWMNLVPLALAGVFIGFFHPVAAGAVFRFSERWKAFWMGLFLSFGIVGYAISPSLVGLTLERGVLTYARYHLLGAVAMSLVLALFYPRRLDASFQPDSVAVTATDRGATPWALLFRLYFLVVFRQLSQLSVITFWPAWMSDQGWMPARIGLWVSLFLLPGPLLGSLIGAWADRSGGRTVLWSCQWLNLIGWLLFFFAPGPLHWAGFLLAGTALMGPASVNVVMAQKVAPRHLGLVSGMMMGLAWGVAGLMLPAVGAFASLTSVRTALLVTIPLALVSLGLIWTLPRDARL